MHQYPDVPEILSDEHAAVTFATLGHCRLLWHNLGGGAERSGAALLFALGQPTAQEANAVPTDSASSTKCLVPRRLGREVACVIVT